MSTHNSRAIYGQQALIHASAQAQTLICFLSFLRQPQYVLMLNYTCMSDTITILVKHI
jgi:hypothetical protein